MGVAINLENRKDRIKKGISSMKIQLFVTLLCVAAAFGAPSRDDPDATTTAGPVTTTAGPATTTAGPATTTAAPATTTAGPATTTAGPTDGPTAGPTTAGPTDGTTAGPTDGTTDGPTADPGSGTAQGIVSFTIISACLIAKYVV